MEFSISQILRLSGEAFSRLLQASPNYEARLTPTAFLTLSGEPLADLNYAIIADEFQAADRLKEYVQVVRSRNLPVIMFFSPKVAKILEPIAKELDLLPGGQVPLMVYSPKEIRSKKHNFQIEKVENARELQEANSVFSEAFGLPTESITRVNNANLLNVPGVNTFILKQDDTVISIAQSTDAGSAVGIWAMGTSPEHRRKGAGHALLNYLLEYHHGLGAKLFFLLATESGKPLYEKVGFRTTAEAVAWVVGHSTQVASN